MTSPTGSEPTPAGSHWEQSLLAEADWVQRLAVRLLGHAGPDADDLAQSVLADALERRPSVDGGLRGWLAVVTRRLAGQWRRRSARGPERLEQPIASEEHGPSEGLARLEQHQWLLDHVSRLPEPYRSTIIGRYLEGRSVEQMAERQELSAAAVRKQLSRGIAMLRARVEGDPTGDGRARLLGIAGLPAVPGAGVPAPPPWMPVTLLMKTKLVVAAAVALGLSLWWIEAESEPEPVHQLETAQVAERSAAPPAALEQEAAVSRAPADAGLPGLRVPVDPGAVRFVDADGSPIPGVFAALFPAGDAVRKTGIGYASADEAGEFDWPQALLAERYSAWRIVAAVRGRTPMVTDLKRPAAGEVHTIVYGGAEELRGTLVLHAEAVSMMVEDEARLPATLRVRKVLPKDVPRSIYRRFVEAGVGSPLAGGRVDVDPMTGRFRVAGLAVGERVSLEMPSDEAFLFDPSLYGPAQVKLAFARIPGEQRDVQLRVMPSPMISGRVVFEDGQPADRARVRFVVEEDSDQATSMPLAETGPDGRFRARLQPEQGDPVVWMDPARQPRVLLVRVFSSHRHSAESKEKRVSFSHGVRLAEVGDVVLKRSRRIYVRAMGPTGKPAKGVRFAFDTIRSVPTDGAGYGVAPVPPDWNGEPLFAGGRDYLVDHYPVSGGTGSGADPYVVKLRRSNALVFQLELKQFELDDVQLLVAGPEQLFHGEEADQTNGLGLHGGRDPFVFDSYRRDSATGVRWRIRREVPADGLCLSSLVPGTELRVAVADLAGARLVEQQVTVPPFGVHEDVVLRVDRAVCRVEARVLLPEGVSRETARVTLRGGRGVVGRPGAIRLQAGDDGVFRGCFLESGARLTLAASAVGCVPQETEVQLSSGVSRVSLSLDRELSLEVVAKFPDEEIASVEVDADQGRVERAPSGGARISELGLEPVTVSVRHAGRLFTKNIHPARQAGPVTFELPRPMSVPLRIPASVPSDAIVVVSARGLDGGVTQRVTLHQEAGTWQPTSIDLHPGRYSVTTSFGQTAGLLRESLGPTEWLIRPGRQTPRSVLR